MRLLLTTSALGLCLSLFAQTDQTAPTPRTWEIGINATSFINTFLSFNDVTSGSGNYLFSLKKLDAQQKGMRLGLNLDFNNDKTDLNNVEGTRINDLAAVSMRLGKEWQIPVYNRWYLLTGYDFLGSYRYSSTETDSDTDLIKISTITYSLGAGPFLGVQFRINERIGLFTESTLYFIHARGVNKVDSENFPSQDQKRKSSSNNLNLQTPFSLFFYFKF